MQWDKVKNILLIILVLVNGFLLGNLGLKLYENQRKETALLENVGTLLEAQADTLAPSFTFPQDRRLPVLSIDRSRPDEETVARAILGEAQQTEDEQGTVRFENETGWMTWGADGTVEGSFTGAADGIDEIERARALLSDWGLWEDNGTLSAQTDGVRYQTPVAGTPVHNRFLLFRFSEQTVALSGVWTFGTPYTTVAEVATDCAAADALLSFTAEQAGNQQIEAMTLGYRLDTEGGRRTQLIPTWEIRTDTDMFLVDCARKTVIS